MSREIMYLWCFLFCLGACNDDRFLDSDPAVSPFSGEVIPVSLALDVAPLLSPLSGTTRTDTGGSGLQASFSGMEVELSDTPVVNTRVLQDNREDAIYSMVIMQFDGATAEAPCVQSTYIETGAKAVDLSKFAFKATTSPISRITVMVNVSWKFFDLAEWNGGGKTFQELLDYYDKKSAEYLPGIFPLYTDVKYPGNRSLMFGMTDVKLEVGKQVSVVLYRTFAKVSFDITIAPELQSKYPVWQAQLSNLPGRSYIVSLGRGVPFPSTQLLGNDGYYNSPAALTMNGSFGAQVNEYIPINLQPDILTASPQTRTILAPLGATYLQLVGLKMSASGRIEDQVIYMVYLGHNFTTDYSISPNTWYNYTINVKGDNGLDRTVVRFIPGYWAGELKAYDANGGVVPVDSENARKWQYDKQLEVYPFDLVNSIGSPTTGMTWGPGDASIIAFSTFSGQDNTWNIHGTAPKAAYEASYACYVLNRVVSVKDDLKWYQPSINQLIGTYLASSNIMSTLSEGYWASTMYSGTKALYLTKYGEIAVDPRSSTHFVRAVRDVTSAY